MKIARVLAATALSLIGSVNAHAASSSVTGNIIGVLITADSSFGGCMIDLSSSPSDRLGNCGAGWVTFDCAGVLPNADAVRAYRMLDQAQLAYAAGKRTTVYFTDEKIVNGYCFAHRIDLQ